MDLLESVESDSESLEDARLGESDSDTLDGSAEEEDQLKDARIRESNILDGCSDDDPESEFQIGYDQGVCLKFT